MIFYPAIDIRGGKAVRLRQGDFGDETVYNDDPVEAARSWVQAGARFLHVIDLDGAREGKPQNLDHLERITDAVRVPVQYGGGLREIASVRAALAAGADRAILGTAAYSDMEFLDACVASWPSRTLVAVDVRAGRVSVAGWTKATQMLPDDVIERLQARGVRQFIYTNVDRDGMLEGPDLEEIKRIAGIIRGRFLYSAGIGSLKHLQALKDLRLLNLAGVVSGKALYERRFTISQAQALLDD
jgi:phosphoribosylformimino-5-aminoimidazole carboxamide ribotide isomerase